MIQFSVQGLCKSFGDRSVLKGIDFELRQGESWVVIGGSGCGKSVLLKCLLGLIDIDQGQVSFQGRDISFLPALQRGPMMEKMSMLFQGGALFDSLTVWENVSFKALQRKDVRVHEARDKAIEKLHRVGLSQKVAFQYPSELSGGMQKRVALARAIADDPQMIFFDEPTTGLDPVTGHLIANMIRDLISKLGISAITITHDMVCAKTIADQVGMLYDGQFRWKGPSHLLEECQDPLVHQFITGSVEGPLTT